MLPPRAGLPAAIAASIEATAMACGNDPLVPGLSATRLLAAAAPTAAPAGAVARPGGGPLASLAFPAGASFGTPLISTTGFDLIDFGVFNAGGNTNAQDLNAAGQVVGATERPGGIFTAWAWTPAAGYVAIPPAAGGLTSYALGNNAAGQVVGYSRTAQGDFRAFTWRAGTPESGLTDLGKAPESCSSYGFAINQAGDVVGSEVLRSCLNGTVWPAPPPPRFTVGDRVWHDANSNGQQDPGEPGFAGVKLALSRTDGTPLGTTNTSGDGLYGFGDLPAGTYRVCVTAGLPAGAVQTYDLDGLATANCADAAVGPSRSDVDFGYVRPGGVLGDYTWIDANGNGRQDAGEPALAGVKLTLTGSATGVQTSSATGAYLFSALPKGTFTVTATAPAGFVATAVGAPGTTNANDSNGNPTTVTLTVWSGSDLTVDFGFVPRAGSGQGCTPGYWKQSHHYDSWRWYSPTDRADVVFGVTRSPALTLDGALSAGGNANASQMFRHGTAALLNAVYQSGVSYPYTAPQVIAMVRDAWNSGSSAKWSEVQNKLAAANEAGCPLN